MKSKEVSQAKHIKQTKTTANNQVQSNDADLFYTKSYSFIIHFDFQGREREQHTPVLILIKIKSFYVFKDDRESSKLVD